MMSRQCCGHYGFAADGLAERQRQRRARFFVFHGAEEFAQENGLAALIGKLDADDVASGNHRDARRHRAHGAGDIVGQ
jgi:hypothetical protein